MLFGTAFERRTGPQGRQMNGRVRQNPGAELHARAKAGGGDGPGAAMGSWRRWDRVRLLGLCLATAL